VNNNHTDIILGKVDSYIQSINTLDTALAKTLWLDIPGVSFIHPKGHEVGLENILTQFYQNTMGLFSKRKLKPYDIAVQEYGNTAVVVFYWNFYATFKEDGTDLESSGRETQIFVLDNGQWKLAHIHYSGMPVDDTRDGL